MGSLDGLVVPRLIPRVRIHFNFPSYFGTFLPSYPSRIQNRYLDPDTPRIWDQDLNLKWVHSRHMPIFFSVFRNFCKINKALPTCIIKMFEKKSEIPKKMHCKIYVLVAFI